jgi:hypothetical protein
LYIRFISHRACAEGDAEGAGCAEGEDVKKAT